MVGLPVVYTVSHRVLRHIAGSRNDPGANLVPQLLYILYILSTVLERCIGKRSIIILNPLRDLSVIIDFTCHQPCTHSHRRSHIHSYI